MLCTGGNDLQQDEFVVLHGAVVLDAPLVNKCAQTYRDTVHFRAFHSVESVQDIEPISFELFV